MKNFLSLTVLLSLLAVLSCSKKPSDLPVSQSATATKSIDIIAAAGSTIATEITFTLSDFTELSKYQKWVKSGSVQTDNSSISVSGVSVDQLLELTNIKLSLKSNSKTNLTMSTITDNVSYSELKQLNFLQKIIDEVVKKGKSTIVLSYRTTHDITKPISFSIKINARFLF